MEEKFKFCKHCGEKIAYDAVICIKCGRQVDAFEEKFVTTTVDDGNKFARFLLTFFLGFIGSFIINHTSLKPHGYKSRTCAYFFLSIITCGIYGLVASICNFSFNPRQESNIGYYKI